MEEKLLNPSQFLILLKMVRHMHKDDGDKDCHWGLPSIIFNFDNFTISYYLTWKIFADCGILCYFAVNVPHHQEPQKYDIVWELTTFNLTWCDKTKSVVICLLMVVMCFQNWRFHQNSQNKRLKKNVFVFLLLGKCK